MINQRRHPKFLAVKTISFLPALPSSSCGQRCPIGTRGLSHVEICLEVLGSHHNYKNIMMPSSYNRFCAFVPTMIIAQTWMQCFTFFTCNNNTEIISALKSYKMKKVFFFCFFLLKNKTHPSPISGYGS